MPSAASHDDPLTAPREVPDQVSGHDPGRTAAPVRPFVPVIPAGGAGTRLWPLSRADRPKFLLDPLGQGRSLLQATLARVEPSADRPAIVVTGARHAQAVAAQLGSRAPGAGPRILREPSPRNSMPAIALAAALVEAEDPGAVIGSFPADHLVGDEAALTRAIAAARAAAARGYLVTIGIEPTRPATGFGYIERADGTPVEGAGGAGALPSLAGTGAQRVASFVEKPDAERAARYLTGGHHLWNAGIFVAGARELLDALAAQIPPLAAGARRIAAARIREAAGESSDDRVADRVLEEVWPTLTSIAIDHALAEPLAAQGRVAVVPADLDWDDVGDFAALARQLRREGDAEARDVVVVGGARTVDRRARATVYGSSQRPIALVGVDGLSVVETDDVLLIAADSGARDLAELVAGLEDEGLADLR
ncbi:mannose-1-phosphate guanylyltransferase [Brachybacterium kimchii]|uniref:Sugar phosphate nucleotidyltransferase n=1 Tax=Brachybacterium kimchii TaxID=2942909 RepID=A0ABY4N875_9MICO|nr:sugar phosphate nucleotidyltransferase [Brachybacterium kimchii]UQN30011.1 sugar phosphate nucleotidyltransferase [Brachybacterium kimchii]